MKASSVFFVSGALIFALGGALLGSALLSSESPPPKSVNLVSEPPKVSFKPVLIASKTLMPGEFIDAASIEWHAVNKAYSEDSYFIKGVDEKRQLFGATVTQVVAAGSVLESDYLVSPGEPGFIASVLKPGMRAVAIPADVVTSNAGLVAGGDRVDVILSLKRDQEQGVSQSSMVTIELPKLASQTLLRNVRVLALNDRVETFVRGKFEKTQESQAKKRKSYETVTLEVYPKDVERLTVAREIGTLQLALRSVVNSEREMSQMSTLEEERLDGVTTLGEVTDIYDSFKPKENAEKTSVVMFRGEAQATTDFLN